MAREEATAIRRRGGVLCVGLICLDIINICDRYPNEDEDMRAKSQKWCKGGNAANTAAVIKMLDSSNSGEEGKRTVEFFGTVGSGVETQFVLEQLDQYRVDHAHCVVHHGYQVPTSCVTLNTTTGSRTIIHYRNLPELKYTEFESSLDLDTAGYSWIHFEGKHPDELSKMVAAIRDHNSKSNNGCPPITISIELEKKRDFLKQLEPLPDVLFISKEYALYRGYQTPEEACLRIRDYCRNGVIVICAWGANGATATNSKGEVVTAPSFPPSGGVVDTLGAGDTFNGAVIHSLLEESSVEDAILFGCKVAGAKCGMDGFDGLKNINWNSK